VTTTLQGIRIVSTAVNIPGPVATSILRDMGAAIVKVEPPNGDPLSRIAAQWYAELSAGMEVIRVNLKSDRGRAQLDQILTTTDVLLTSSRPSSLERLGLAWREVHSRHPRLCSVAIVGHAAPLQDVAGHDLTYQANVGLVTPPAMPRTLIADLAGAQRAVIVALELLFARERTGEGGYVEVSLTDSARLFAEPVRHGLTGSTGPLGGADAVYNLYSTRDGWVAVAALEPQFHAALARELGVPVDDRAVLTRALSERSALEWERWAIARGLPIAAVR
jgi:alpha-methylacyl-CoA racemase